MKIIHLSDTHLGFAAYRKLSEKGFNQREEDILLSFQLAIDKIISLKPDLVLHSGDLFDSVRPSNRILYFAIKEILRLIEHQIKVIIISGNHDTPRQRYLGSVFAIFKLLPVPPQMLWIVAEGEYQKIEIKDLLIHAIPQCQNQEIFEAELKKAIPEKGKKNILMLHAGVREMKEFSEEDFNELVIDQKMLKKSFDYIALGHYHGYFKVYANAYFSGSTERMSFNEVGKEKGFLEVDLEKGSPSFRSLPIRPMEEIPPLNALNLTSDEIFKEIEGRLLARKIKDKIIRLKVINISENALSNLDFKKINPLTQKALHFDLHFEKASSHKSVKKAPLKIRGLREEYQDYIKRNLDLSNKEEKDLLELGFHYLDRVMEKS